MVSQAQKKAMLKYQSKNRAKITEYNRQWYRTNKAKKDKTKYCPINEHSINFKQLPIMAPIIIDVPETN
tara:strand:+ start:3699 stop:3905 length:207 start_codon:yes stop_codon:yes gene_type:complete